MITISQFLNEKYYNAFTKDQKKKYADQVWDILTQSYKQVGGIRGIKSKEDLINNPDIKMWKLSKHHDDVKVAIIYKDKGKGRKLVAVGTNGTLEAKKLLGVMLKDEFSRSFFEISGPLLKFMQNKFPELVKQFTIAHDDVEKILSVTVTPTKDGMYKRTIRGEILQKIMLGTHGKTIS